MTKEVLLQTIDVVKEYGVGDVRVAALDGVSIDIQAGEFTAIMGPSGSGKSTLMYVLGCLAQPSSGQYIISGEDVSGLDKVELATIRNRRIGFVFQSYNLLPRTTALENVMMTMLYAQVQSRSAEQRRAHALHTLAAVGLEDRVNSRPSKLSGGQQQRVAVARALASKPKFILADEPTANLDSKSTETLLDIMEDLNREEGITFIFSTHDARVVKKARRVITVEDGKVISDERKN